MFLTKIEKQLSDEYLLKGFIIRQVADIAALEWIRSQFIRMTGEILGAEAFVKTEDILNQIHQVVPLAELNSFRLQIIRGLNSIEGFREMYFRIARPYLEILVGNELAMQARINLSIQFPGDESSLLPLHADTWSGDSPFEVVVWLPLVNCYGTKTMYLMSPQGAADLSQGFVERAGKSSEQLYQSIKEDVRWLDVQYGDVLIFDQALPHGNRVNEESETRWSMNCRFKGVFTPYGDKKIGEFFEPITLRAASKNGISYRLPEMS
jgi:sporadic carbohydrate cluster 2OG-Fe(II) oxygenase